MIKPTIFAASLSLLLFSPFTLADNHMGKTITATAVSGNIYMIKDKGGNIGVFTGPDGTFLIDDQFAPVTEAIIDAVKAVGGNQPRFLLNTHFHGDHTGGNENFGKLGTLIVSHDNVRERLESGYHVGPFKMTVGPASRDGMPVITFNKSMTFHLNGEQVRATHVPHAHTDGDSFVHFEKSNVIHAGDFFFNGFYPFIDVQNGGSLKGMIRAVDKVLARADDKTKIIPGHGPLGDKKSLSRYRDMLATAYQRLSRLKAEGKSAAEAVAAKPLKDLEKEWGGVIFTGDRWIEIIYPGV